MGKNEINVMDELNKGATMGMDAIKLTNHVVTFTAEKHGKVHCHVEKNEKYKETT